MKSNMVMDVIMACLVCGLSFFVGWMFGSEHKAEIITDEIIKRGYAERQVSPSGESVLIWKEQHD